MFPILIEKKGPVGGLRDKRTFHEVAGALDDVSMLLVKDTPDFRKERYNAPEAWKRASVLLERLRLRAHDIHYFHRTIPVRYKGILR